MFDKKDNKNNEQLITDVFRPSKGSSKVILGNGVIIKGEVTQADDVQIDGQADLTIKTNNLIIGGTGILKGNISTNNLDVWGRLEGDVKVEGTLTIQEQGIVEGNIEYQDLHIKLGGQIKGEVKSLDKIKKISDIKVKTLQEADNIKETSSN